MESSPITAQLNHDYPERNIVLDADNQMLKVDGENNVLLLSSSAIRRMDIFTSAGKHFYQVIVNLIYSRFDILPEKGSYADSLIVTKEELREYRVRKAAQRYKVGFLEDDEGVFAIGIDDGKNFPLLSEESEVDLLEEEDWDTGLNYYKYSLWSEDDPFIEELETIEDDPE